MKSKNVSPGGWQKSLTRPGSKIQPAPVPTPDEGGKNPRTLKKCLTQSQGGLGFLDPWPGGGAGLFYLWLGRMWVFLGS